MNISREEKKTLERNEEKLSVIECGYVIIKV